MCGAMQTVFLIVIVLLQVFILGGGIFLADYLKQKAKNLATREEFNEVKQQTAEIKKVTAKIESDIKGELWDRQKRWELRRDLLLQATKRISALDEALTKYKTYVDVRSKATNKDDNDAWYVTGLRTTRRWSKAHASFDESRMLVNVVCGKDVKTALDELSAVIGKIIPGLIADDGNVYDEHHEAFFKAILKSRAAIRKELGADEL
jgi:hypothetical protein